MMTDAVPALPQGKRYLTIRQTAQAYPAMTESALRWLRFNGDANGFNRCILAVGRKLLIDADAFEQWLESHRNGQAAA
ncbi:MAG: hypothetical protein LC775_14960 [Acidobacteria bacterium]|nr:hypothetical protein [Acidobacteriota bacterium]